MKKLLFAFPILALLATGCNSSQQAAFPIPVGQNTKQSSTPSTTPPEVSQPKQVNCQEYKNHGIALSCPKDFYLIDFENTKGGIANANIELTFYNKKKIYNIEESSVYAVYIGIKTDIYNSSINDYLKTTNSSIINFETNSGLELDKNITIGGKTAYRLKCKSKTSYCDSEDIVFVNGNVYQFINNAWLGNETLPIYNTILSSVKFLTN